MNIEVADKKIYAIDDKVGEGNAQAKANELKGKAFGLISQIFSRPKGEDIEVRYVERRYEPFWHILCKTHIEYNRSREYGFDSEPVVKKVVLDGVEHDVAEKGKFTVSGTEYCVEDAVKEVYVDASTGKEENHTKHVNQAKKEIRETEELMVGDTIVMPAKVKASFLTRDIVTGMLKPVKAEEVTAEEIKIEKLHLYFRPIYAFEYYWKDKDKTATIEMDAATLEAKSGGKAVRQKMKELVSEVDLFDIGTGAVDLFVPGGGLAIKLAKGIMKSKK